MNVENIRSGFDMQCNVASVDVTGVLPLPTTEWPIIPRYCTMMVVDNHTMDDVLWNQFSSVHKPKPTYV